MLPADQHSLRLVVQHVCENSSGRSSYRLVGYSDDQNYRPVEFESLDELLKVLKAAMPGFDASSFSKERPPVSSILFADLMELSAAQLSALGLTE